MIFVKKGDYSREGQGRFRTPAPKAYGFIQAYVDCLVYCKMSCQPQNLKLHIPLGILPDQDSIEVSIVPKLLGL